MLLFASHLLGVWAYCGRRIIPGVLWCWFVISKYPFVALPSDLAFSGVGLQFQDTHRRLCIASGVGWRWFVISRYSSRNGWSTVAASCIIPR
jgi:hypothetical protein